MRSLCRFPAGSFRFLIVLIDPAIPTQSGQTILSETQRGPLLINCELVYLS